MNAFAKAKCAGFSLIELLIGIIIVGILAALAMPSFQQMLRNSEVRNAAESIANGLQRARAEAVARNTDVEFVLEAGSSWVVRVVSAPNPPIDSRSGDEGSRNVTLVAVNNDLAPATTVTFNNLGQVKDLVTAIKRVDLAAPGATQNLRVAIQPGGAARMCDPSLAAGSSPRACNIGD